MENVSQKRTAILNIYRLVSSNDGSFNDTSCMLGRQTVKTHLRVVSVANIPVKLFSVLLLRIETFTNIQLLIVEVELKGFRGCQEWKHRTWF